MLNTASTPSLPENRVEISYSQPYRNGGEWFIDENHLVIRKGFCPDGFKYAHFRRSTEAQIRALAATLHDHIA